MKLDLIRDLYTILNNILLKTLAINSQTWYNFFINSFSERSEPSDLSFMYGGL